MCYEGVNNNLGSDFTDPDTGLGFEAVPGWEFVKYMATLGMLVTATYVGAGLGGFLTD